MTIQCEWGLHGLHAHKNAAVAVIVDVLSFSTAVDVAVSRGAFVYPFPLGDRAAAATEAERVGAVLAQPRRTAGGQFSLSPVSLKAADSTTRIVLPSPNGSRLTLEAPQPIVLAGCLRNARAVAAAAINLADGGDIVVVPAGERWADGSLRPAIEDWIGAGAIIQELARAMSMSTEARSARAAFHAVSDQISDIVRKCVSGRELIDADFADDVELAVEANSSETAPRLLAGAYRF